MTKVWYRVISTAVFLVLLLASSHALAAPVVLEVAVDSQVKAIIDEYPKINPSVKIEYRTPYRENFDKLAVDTASGVAADIMVTYNEVPFRAIRNGMFLDLQPFILRDKMQSTVKDFIPGTIAMASFNGGVFGFPYYSSSGAMYVNLDMFDNAGIGLPPRSWTWEDMAGVAQKMTRRGADGQVSVYGFSLPVGWLQEWPWLWQAGAEAHINGDPSTVALDSPQATKALEFLQGLINQSVCVPDPVPFFVRQAAMLESGGWDYIYMDGSFRIGITSLPAGPAGRATFTNTDIMSISATTKHPEEAWQFLKWYYDRDTQERVMKATTLQPARMSIGYNWVKEVLAANAQKELKGLDVFVVDAQIARPQPFYSDSTVVSTILQPAIADILRNNKPVGPTLAEATRVANAALKAASRK